MIAVALVLVAVVGAAVVLFALAVAGLPPFGGDSHPYRDLAVAAAVQQSTANVVASLTFDLRDLDILLSYVFLPLTLLVGLDLLVHGHLTQGGGFQGGVVLATGLHLLYLSGGPEALRRLRPRRTEVQLLAYGVLTALVGTVMCAGQRHLKRLLAYSTIAHGGLFLVAAGLGTARSLAGVALAVAGHAGTKGALFLVCGLLLDRHRSVDEGELHGRGGGRREPACWLFLGAALLLAGLPPFGPSLGKAVAEEAGGAWLPAVSVLVSAVTGGAVLRAGLRVFLGVGRRLPPPRSDETYGVAALAALVGLPLL